MRDLGTYEAKVCSEIKLSEIYKEVHELVRLTNSRINQMVSEQDNFMNKLVEKASEGVNKVAE